MCSLWFQTDSVPSFGDELNINMSGDVNLKQEPGMPPGGDQDSTDQSQSMVGFMSFISHHSPKWKYQCTLNWFDFFFYGWVKMGSQKDVSFYNGIWQLG